MPRPVVKTALESDVNINKWNRGDGGETDVRLVEQ
jgi:hypothetical protein